jgi:LysM repeat protein
MKSTLMLATLSIALICPSAFAKSELEVLRSRCSDQEKQIHHLEGENSRLKGGNHEKRAAVARAKPISNAPSKAKVQASNRPGYTVVAGDSLEKIARKLGTSPRKLGALNGLKASTIIRPGQKLKAPGASAGLATTRTPATRKLASSGKVRHREELASVSSKRRDRSENSVAAEPKKQPANVQADQGTAPATQMIAASKLPSPEENLTLPVAQVPPTPQPTQAAAATASADPKPAAGTEAVASKSDKKIRAITIDGEMTYGEFATKHGTDAERLNALNGLDLTTATVLAKGSELYVPAQP